MNGTNVHEVSVHLRVSLAHVEDSFNNPLLLPTSSREVQTEPILTKCFLSLLYSSFCNSMCFGPVRRRSLVIRSRFFEAYHKFFWTQECSEIPVRLLTSFDFCMDNFVSETDVQRREHWPKIVDLEL